MKDAGIFWVAKKTKGFLGVAKKGLRDFFGYAKKSSNFYWQTNSEVVIFLGIKYIPLFGPPPPPPLVVKICEWGPWELSLLVNRIAHKAIEAGKQYHDFTCFRK